ncbi:hypothetical protein DACRYDRAFT_98503 [Dacryopinax primogenitus]|uniref:Malate dehydrogenase n=1 Tax=Dacryopinax primogenitus (strain DJM 731) TaxID=1858805 RepID=M5GFZ7_DACPD|nr:uncharacterized protein DACRYDRAFT_98503 [Dacryopinax primogenitus]EJU04608.1 hypothetical protein DACRYDRAFT_98503 [Dacryopinax primogenitus]
MHCLFKLMALALAVLPLVSADLHAQGTQPHCSVANISLPDALTGDSHGLTNLTALIPPANVSIVQVTIGFGAQNYTCTQGKYVNVGAVAQVFDISCIQNLPSISAGLSLAINELESVAGEGLLNFITMLAKMGGFKLADHYFDTSSGALAPVFNFQISGGGFAIGKKLQDIPDPVNPIKNVDWLQLTAVQGDAAKFLVREQTVGGQPPASCAVENETLQVPYAAKYWFFG